MSKVIHEEEQQQGAAGGAQDKDSINYIAIGDR